MYDTSAVWTFVGPDGSSISFNDAGSMLMMEDVTGFDSPNVRENTADLPELDGAAAGDFFYGARPVTFSGLFYASTPAQRNLLAVQLQAALRGLRGDVTILSQAQGLPAMQVTGRFQNLRITKRDGIAKSFQFGLMCVDPRIYSQAINVATGSGSVATNGAPFPLAFPINFGGGSGVVVSISVTNAGNFTAPVTLRLTGPIDNPRITNATTGENFYLDSLSLAPGEYVDIDMLNRTVVKNDGTSQYASVRVPGSAWFLLQPGGNVLELRSTSLAASATLAPTWRDAWA